MDKQETLKNLLIAGAVFLLVMSLIQTITPPPTKQPGPTTGTTETATPSKPAAPKPESALAASFRWQEAPDVTTVGIGAALADDLDPKHPGPYRLHLLISNVGASVATATLADHAQELDKPDRYRLLTPIERDDKELPNSLAIEKANVDGVDFALYDKKWHLEPKKPYERKLPDGSTESGETVTAWIELTESDHPALRLTRTFYLPKQSIKSGRHDVWTDLRVKNLSDATHTAVITYLGGLGVPQGNSRMADEVVDYGVLEDNRVDVKRTRSSSVASSKSDEPAGTEQTKELFKLDAKDKARLDWAANSNTYFTCTIAPQSIKGDDAPAYVSSLAAVDLDGDRNTLDDVTTRLVTAGQQLEPGAAVRYPAALYIGEKDADSFKSIPDYARRNYYRQISLGFGYCTFTWLVELMIWLLEALHYVVRDYGVAIIALVVIVRTLLHPITKRGQVNMVRMQQKMGEFTPKLEALKKKYANDKPRLNQETAKLYQEQGINPAGQLLNCLPMALQMPVWMALYLSLSNSIGMRHQGAFFLPWVGDLTAPDALIRFAHPLVVPFFHFKIESFNLLPFLAGLGMYIQQKTQPKPEPNPGSTAEQRQQQEMMQKMMPLMSLLMMFFFYNMPSGLNLYISCSQFFGWIEQKRIRAHIEEQKESGAFMKPVANASKRKRPGLWQKLQKMAEDAQEQQARRDPKKGKSGR